MHAGVGVSLDVTLVGVGVGTRVGALTVVAAGLAVSLSPVPGQDAQTVVPGVGTVAVNRGVSLDAGRHRHPLLPIGEEQVADVRHGRGQADRPDHLVDPGEVDRTKHRHQEVGDRGGHEGTQEHLSRSSLRATTTTDGDRHGARDGRVDASHPSVQPVDGSLGSAQALVEVALTGQHPTRSRCTSSGVHDAGHLLDAGGVGVDVGLGRSGLAGRTPVGDVGALDGLSCAQDSRSGTVLSEEPLDPVGQLLELTPVGVEGRADAAVDEDGDGVGVVGTELLTQRGEVLRGGGGVHSHPSFRWSVEYPGGTQR